MFSRQPIRDAQTGTRKYVRDNHLHATVRGRIDNLGAHEKQQREYAKVAKKEKDERDAKLNAYMKEFTELNTKAYEDLAKARDKYRADMEKYREYLDNIKRYGEPTNKRKIMKEPKDPKFKAPVVPNAKERFGVHGGRRRTQRGRKTRSTRRR